MTDPWDYNHNTDPLLRAQREETAAKLALIEELRLNRLANTPHPGHQPPQIVHHQRRRRHPLATLAYGLLILCIGLGSCLTLIAWALAGLSAIGTIPAPPPVTTQEVTP